MTATLHNSTHNSKAGKYCATSGLAVPTGDCSAGYFCSGGSSDPTPSIQAYGGYCPAGHYCVAGSAAADSHLAHSTP